MTLDRPLRFHRLKKIAECPAEFLADVEAKTRATSVGSAAHSMILGGQPVVGYKGKQRRGKKYDAWKKDQDPTAMILTASEFRIASGMAEAVRTNPLAMKLLDGDREKTIHWTDDGGIECRGTPDAISDRYRTDLKTGETADPRLFLFKILRFCYHGQLAWYERGLGLAEPLHNPERQNCIVSVRAKYPFHVTCFRFTPNDMDKGRRIVRSWLEQLRVCLDSGHFPPYSETLVDVDLPDEENGLIFPDEQEETQ